MSRRAVEASLGVPRGSFELLEDFFRPLPSLGAHPRHVVGWLRRAGIRRGAKILDVGCGKGAVSVAAACALGCLVEGVDAHPGFVREAELRARGRRVQSRCTFRCGLAEQIRGNFDAVVVLNLFPFEKAVHLARARTRPGGVYLFDDAVSDDPIGGFPLVEEVDHFVRRTGDRVLARRVWTPAEVLRRERRNLTRLKRHARTLAAARPRDAEVFRECLARYEAGMNKLCGPAHPACWLVRKSR